MNGLTRREWDISYGLHSGIPICCVMNFVNSSGLFDALPYEDKWEHQPCRECFTTKRVISIDRCKDECPPWGELLRSTVRRVAA